jgi:glycosyltransferase involved in cell wall biosynthesis
MAKMLETDRRVHFPSKRQWRLFDPEGVSTAYVSSYPPRECGLATFCQDLLMSTQQCELAGEPMVVAMTCDDSPREYGWPVQLMVDREDEAGYEAAAEFLNASPVELVNIQHEFGIFGGAECGGLDRFLKHLSKPVITTLHTVLPDPSPAQRRTVQKLAMCSERVVVMNELATGILNRCYGIGVGKVVLIHHGAPAPSAESRAAAKARLGLSSRKVLSTFGLVSSGKGLEYAVEALPAIREQYPEVCYLIIGKTHPGVQRVEKEGYREKLVRMVEELRLEGAVQFINQYQTKESILRYLAATDVYLTPYLNPHQICSGTLAYAVASGKAVVSTPYLYARFLLAEGRGRLVEFRSPEAIAEAVGEVLGNPDHQGALEARTRAYGRSLYWPTVGGRFSAVCHEAVRGQVAVSETVAHSASGWPRSRDVVRVDQHDDAGRDAHITGSLAATD